MREQNAEKVLLEVEGRWMRLEVDVFFKRGKDIIDDAMLARFASAFDRLGIVGWNHFSLGPLEPSDGAE